MSAKRKRKPKPLAPGVGTAAMIHAMHPWAYNRIWNDAVEAAARVAAQSNTWTSSDGHKDRELLSEIRALKRRTGAQQGGGA